MTRRRITSAGCWRVSRSGPAASGRLASRSQEVKARSCVGAIGDTHAVRAADPWYFPRRVRGAPPTPQLIRILLAAGPFVALAVLKTFPLVTHLGTHLPGDLGDPLFNAWVLAWDVHALGHDLGRFFDANIGFPVELSLAFSDHLLGVLPIAGPVLRLTGNPLAAYHTLFILSFALSGCAAFCFAHSWTGAFWPSLVAGVLYGFAPWRFGQIAHLQLLGFFWAPLALIFLDRTLRQRRWRDLWLFALFWWLQILAA